MRSFREPLGFPNMRPRTIRTFAALVVLLVATNSATAAGGEPKSKDSPARFQPKQVALGTKVVPAKAKPGETVTYSVTVTMKKGWHIYGYVKKQADEGPQGTEFDFFDTDGLKIVSEWTPDKKPEVHNDAAFNNMKVELHEGVVTFATKLKVPADAKPGKRVLRSQIYFQSCDATKCNPPAYITGPDADLEIIGGGTTLAPGGRNAVLAALIVGANPLEKMPAPSKKITGELGKALNGGLLAFLLYSAAGGLIALMMPCVWPMIPITVNFFVKQGEKKQGATTGLAVAYCLAIIGIFTTLGLGITLVKGGSGASDLGNNAWMNLLMGIAFIALGASLLGVFEIRLPSSFLNFSAQGEGKGGFIGVMFMALTLTLTSFTCTAPVVGALLGQAAQGQWLYPFLGMLTFSSVLAMPFFVLALMPGLIKKMPKSGDWMNAVKVVGGLIEIGAAFKFLNTAEISFGTAPQNAWFNAGFVLTAWVVVSLVCGLYLLGLFRTNHDHEAVQVGPTRMLIGMTFLGISLFLAPALFGVRPQNKVFNAVVGILPPDTDRLDARQETVNDVATRVAAMLSAPGSTQSGRPLGGMAAEAPTIQGPVKATSSDPKVAILEEKKFHGVGWGMSYEAALAEAKKSNKPVLIDFTGKNCANCRTVEATIMTRPEVVAEMRKFVTVALYNDFVYIDSLPVEQQKELANDNKDIQLKLADTIATPVYVVVTPEGKLVGMVDYNPSDSNFLVNFLKEMQKQYKPGDKVAAK